MTGMIFKSQQRRWSWRGYYGAQYEINSNFLPYLAKNHVQKTREFLSVTFDQIYSNICEICDIYFCCKNTISVFNLTENSTSKW